MVQLNTTYDSTLHQKIFILKGDEGYARTTDTIATLITDFDDYTSHVNGCHVGLEIQVLREIGKSNLIIYCDDDVLTIPWSDSGMAQIIDADWNSRGVYWENGKLIIGKYDYENHISNGFFLMYDVDHKITVRYEGNKRCLGSHEDITFNVPKPDTFATELIFSDERKRYLPNATVDDITLTLTCERELTTTKMVDIYDDSQSPSVLLTTVELEQDLASTITLTGLSDGLHHIRASFRGDGECYASESSMEISMGYKLTQLNYPSTLLEDEKGTVSCYVLDYFDEVFNASVFYLRERTGAGWHNLGLDFIDIDGYIEFANMSISQRPYEIYVPDGDYHSELMTTSIISPTRLDIALDKDSIPSNSVNESITVTTSVYSDLGRISDKDVKLTLTVSSPNGLSKTYTGSTDNNGRFRRKIYIQFNSGEMFDGRMTITASLTKNPSITETAYAHIYEHWWSRNKIQHGSPSFRNKATVTYLSNGFRFEANEDKYANVLFGVDRSAYGVIQKFSYEFDVISIDGTFDKIMGQTPSTLGFKSSDHVKIIHDIVSGDYDVYVNDTLKGSYSFPSYGLSIAPSTEFNGIILDNIKIERIE